MVIMEEDIVPLLPQNGPYFDTSSHIENKTITFSHQLKEIEEEKI